MKKSNGAQTEERKRRNRGYTSRGYIFCMLFIAGVVFFMSAAFVFIISSANLEKQVLRNEGRKQEFHAQSVQEKNFKMIKVPYINQKSRYPTGCESVSAVMAMQYYGIEMSVDTFIDQYLDREGAPRTHENIRKSSGGNPWEAFLGNPRSETGWGCYAPVIANALNKAVDLSEYTVKELYNIPLDRLCKDYIDRDIPVIVWATIDMKPPRLTQRWLDTKTGEEIRWIAPMHSLLLIGYDDEYYYFNDPWREQACRYRKKDCETAYKGLYEQAVVLMKK